MIVAEPQTPALDLLSFALRPPKSVLRSAFGEGGRFWRRRALLTEEDRPWTDSARTARFRTGDRTGRTSENACKHWLRTGSRVQKGERVPLRAGIPARALRDGGSAKREGGCRSVQSSKFKNSPTKANTFLRVFARFCATHSLSSFRFPFLHEQLNTPTRCESTSINSFLAAGAIY
jgi:hypothetical protein